MSKSIYLVNPVADAPSYFGAELMQGWDLGPATAFPDLAIATVAAMVPADFDVRICDENLTPIDFDSTADYIGLTGKVSQWSRMQEVARAFRSRGKTVIIGGPFASLCPEVVADHCDILVRNEIEEIAADLFSDLRAESWKEEYIGGRPSMDLTPAPRWDLYPNDRTLLGSVQTSRGCPFACDFCDVIQYLGRKQRHKSIPNVIRELDDLYHHGYRSIFLADDNFTVARKRAKALLIALRDWNMQREDGKVTFSTQISIDSAKDDEMLQLCAQAGLIQVFIGIETPNEESLKASGKRQNLGVNLVEQVQKFYRYGINVTAGMIVGFDGDDAGIFKRQYEFANQASIPIVTLGALVAPAATPLHDRLQQEGRLTAAGSEIAATPWSTNIQPLHMTQDELLHGIRWLANKLYRPEEFGDRLLKFISLVGDRQDPKGTSAPKTQQIRRHSVEIDGAEILKKLIALGPEEARMAYKIFGAVSKKPEAFEFVKTAVFHYAQIRYMYAQGQVWDSQMDVAASPRTSAERPTAVAV